jgi:hypothetical protein
LLLLKLAAAGLIDLHGPDHAETCQITYVSFPCLTYAKGQAINLNGVRKGLETTNQFDLLTCLDPLLSRLSLKVDSLEVTGNTLALAIDLHHYRDSRIPLVTETGMDPDHCRITEKTIKPPRARPALHHLRPSPLPPLRQGDGLCHLRRLPRQQL